MPSSYTAYILEDKLSKPSDFAKLCARAFGACINQRDDSLDAPLEIPKAETSYCEDCLKDAEKKIQKLARMTKTQRINYGKRVIREGIKSAKASIEKHNRNKEKLEKVLLWVYSYVPPTSEHVNFKDFMVQQITDTLKWDGDDSYYQKSLREYEQAVPIQIWADHLTMAVEDIPRYEKRIEEEIARTNERADWIQKLIDSVQN